MRSPGQLAFPNASYFSARFLKQATSASGPVLGLHDLVPLFGRNFVATTVLWSRPHAIYGISATLD